MNNAANYVVISASIQNIGQFLYCIIQQSQLTSNSYCTENSYTEAKVCVQAAKNANNSPFHAKMALHCKNCVIAGKHQNYAKKCVAQNHNFCGTNQYFSVL